MVGGACSAEMDPWVGLEEDLVEAHDFIPQGGGGPERKDLDPAPPTFPPSANSQPVSLWPPTPLAGGGNPWGFLSPSCLLAAPTPCWRKEEEERLMVLHLGVQSTVSGPHLLTQHRADTGLRREPRLQTPECPPASVLTVLGCPEPPLPLSET